MSFNLSMWRVYNGFLAYFEKYFLVTWFQADVSKGESRTSESQFSSSQVQGMLKGKLS